MIEEQEEQVGKRVEDEKHEEYHNVSKLSLPIDRIPEAILKRAHKVFSKHNSTDIREWSWRLMRSYQLLHAVEKPMNLDFVQPFANTSDLANLTPHIDPNLAKKREEEREHKMRQGT